MTVVRLRDVTGRDGLQDVEDFVPTAVKAELVRRIWAAGVRWTEVTSFVSAKRVPQLADALELLSSLREDAPDNVLLSAFAATRRGAERALAAGVGELSTTVPVTDGMSEANFGRDAAQMRQETTAMRAMAPRLPMSVTIAVAFGCPFDGAVEPERVVELAVELGAAGYGTVLLGDTIGVADPAQVEALVTAIREAAPELLVGAHFHDARGAGVANVVAAVRAGARVVDAALGGLGGCPFAPGAAGNVALEDVAWTLDAMGFDIGVDHDGLADTTRWMTAESGLRASSRMPTIQRFDWERTHVNG